MASVSAWCSRFHHMHSQLRCPQLQLTLRWLFPSCFLIFDEPSNFWLELGILASVPEQFTLSCLPLWYFETSLKALKVVNTQPKGPSVWACKVSTSHYAERLCQAGLKSNRSSVASPSLSEEHCCRRRKRPGDNLTDLTWCYLGVNTPSMNIHIACVCVMCVRVGLSGLCLAAFW